MPLRGTFEIGRVEKRSWPIRALLFLPRLLTFGLKLCLPAAVLIYAFTRPERERIEPPRIPIQIPSLPDARTYEEIIPQIDVYKDAGADVPADIPRIDVTADIPADIPTIELIDITPELAVPDAIIHAEDAAQDVRRDGPRHKPDTSHPQPDVSQSQPDVSHQQPEISLPPI